LPNNRSSMDEDDSFEAFLRSKTPHIGGKEGSVVKAPAALQETMAHARLAGTLPVRFQLVSDLHIERGDTVENMARIDALAPILCLLGP
jgi:hypothetical protein